LVTFAARRPKIDGLPWRASGRLHLDDPNPMLTTSNPFAALLDPAGVLNACAQSGALDALPVSAKRCADRMSPNVGGELAEHDAALDEIYRQLIAKAAKTPPPKAKKTARTEQA